MHEGVLKGAQRAAPGDGFYCVFHRQRDLFVLLEEQIQLVGEARTEQGDAVLTHLNQGGSKGVWFIRA